MAKDSNGDDVNDKPESEDSFGLPDLEYKPLEQKAESAPVSASSGQSSEGSAQSSYTEPGVEETKSKAPVILGVVIILVLLIAGYLIYNFVYVPRAAAEKAKKEQEAKAAAEKKKQAEEARIAREKAEAERLRLEAEAKAHPPIGTIETLTGPTRRYYVVVTTNIDDDLLMDFAKKLSAKGISTKVIPPRADRKFYRLAIADHDNYASAQANADAVKADYGGVWVMKY